jgi:hypothetical protein
MIKKILQTGYRRIKDVGAGLAPARPRYRRIKAEPVGVLLCNLVLMLAIYYLCRIFFFIANRSYFTGMTFGHFIDLLKGGFQFDISALAYTCVLYTFMQIIPFRFRLNKIYQNVAKWIFVVINSITVLANCIDVVYFRFSKRRTTNTVFSEFQNENNILKIAVHAVFEYWYCHTVCNRPYFSHIQTVLFPDDCQKTEIFAQIGNHLLFDAYLADVRIHCRHRHRDAWRSGSRNPSDNVK